MIAWQEIYRAARSRAQVEAHEAERQTRDAKRMRLFEQRWRKEQEIGQQLVGGEDDNPGEGGTPRMDRNPQSEDERQ